MIPPEIADLMTLIYADWPELCDEPCDRETFNEVKAAAHRIFDAGYRKPGVVESPKP